MMRLPWISLLVLGGVAFAAPTPTKYTVHIKTVAKDKTVRLVPIGEITRAADGTVTAKAVPAPELDARANKLVADWKAYRHPARVTITERIASDTGMRPSYDPHTFTFTAKDALYKAAVIREFLAKRGYTAYMGMETIDFVEFDSSPDNPPGAHDRASRRSNFRKGTTIPFHGGEHTFYIGVPVRPAVGPGPGRGSATDRTMAVATGNDLGLLEVGRIRLFEDGRIVVEPEYAGAKLERMFARIPAEDIEVRTYVNGAWRTHVVPKTSPRRLEAFILQREHYDNYEIVPPIDPATTR